MDTTTSTTPNLDALREAHRAVSATQDTLDAAYHAAERDAHAAQRDTPPSEVVASSPHPHPHPHVVSLSMACLSAGDAGDERVAACAATCTTGDNSLAITRCQ